MLSRKSYFVLLSLILILTATSFLVSAEINHIESEPPYKLSKDFGVLPVSFEENKGQLHSEYYFVARSSQVTSFVTNNGLIVTHHAKKQPIMVEFEGAEKQIPYGKKPLEGKSNYFVGNDQDKWIRNVSQFEHVVAENIYPGIDVKYHSHGSLLEYDFIVDPGSKVDDIMLNIANVDKLVVESSGDLLIHAGDTVLKQHKPYVYQEINGQKNEIESRYLVYPDNKVSFKVAAYDKTIPLIIDPVLEFSTFLGGEAFSHISDIKVDSTGHIYVVGATNSVYYPTANPAQANYGGGDLDAFVTKLSPDGTSIIYSTYFGGSKREGGGLYDPENASVSTSIAINSVGEAYVAGHTLSNLDFPLVNAYQATFGGGVTDAYLFKLNSTGNSVLFSTYIGGSDDEYFYDLALDSLGNPVAVGHSISSQYPTTTGVIQTSRNAGYNHDGIISKFSTTGSLLFSTYLGGNDDDRLVSVALDSSDNIYVTGETKSTANLPLNNAPQTSHAGNFDMYIAKVNSNGTVLDFGTYWGGTSKDAGRGIALDQNGKIIVVGDSNSSDFPVQSAYQATKAGNFDAVLVKMSDVGVVDFSTYFGDTQKEYGWSVDTDIQNSIYISGQTESINFPEVSPLTEFNTTNTGNYGDAFISKFSSDGSTLSFSSKVGGNGADHGFALDTTSQGGVYLAGLTASNNLHTTTNVVQTTLNGVVAGFIVKLQDTVAGVAPDVSITSPADSSFLNDNTPTISLAFTDNGGGVDVNSVEIEVNGNVVSSTCTGDSSSASCTPDSVISDGAVAISATVADSVGTRSTPNQVTVTIDTVFPVITITDPNDGSFTNQINQDVTGSVNESMSVFTVNGTSVTPDAGNNFTHNVALIEGANTITVIASDLASNQITEAITVNLDTVAPDPINSSNVVISDVQNGQVSVTGSAGAAEGNATVTISNTATGTSITVAVNADGSFAGSIAALDGDNITIVVNDVVGNTSSAVNHTASGGAVVQRMTSFTYDTNGNVLTIDGPRTDIADITTHTYDAQGNRATTSVDPDGAGPSPAQVTQFTSYDNSGRLLSMTDANGIVTNMTYDARGRLLTRTAAVGTSAAATTTFEYDGVGNLTKIILPNSNELIYTYDAASRLTRITDGQGHYIAYTLDNQGNRTKEEVFDSADVLQRTQSRVFNSLSRMIQSIGGATQTTAFGYDLNGNQTSVTDPLNRVTTSEYDGLNRLVKQIDADTNDTLYGYDARDNLTSVTDPRGLVTTYVYNGLDDLEQLNSPDTGTTSYVYDAAGNRIRQIDARGVTTLYTYDALNRLTNISYPNSQYDVSFTYGQGTNGIGRLSSMTDESGSTTYSYDARGNVTTETRIIQSTSYTTSYAYDLADNMTQMTYPSGRIVDYTRNTIGQINAVSTTDSQGTQSLATSITYLPFGPMQSMTLGNGVNTTYSYDQDYRVTSIITDSGIQSLAYSYDLANNITTLTNNQDTSRNQTLGYDNLDRLTSASGIYGSLAYNYDAVGNRTSENTDTYTYDTISNRLASISGSQSATYSYDGAGNILSDGTTTYTVNDTNRRASAAGVTYIYNGRGERLVKTIGANTTHYHFDHNGNLIAESVGSTYKEYIYVNGQRLAMADGINDYYYHNDHLGTPQRITDATKAIVWSADYEPFGETNVTVTTIENNLRFPGQYYDLETQNHYNYFRDYSPQTGRYMQSDPIGLQGGMNTYGYALQNPIRNIDPSGLVTWKGRAEVVNISFFATKLWARYILESECINGEKYKVRVNASGDVSNSFDIGINWVNASASKIEFEDGLATPDPNVFEGLYFMSSLGFNTPIGGIAYTKTVLGRAVSDSAFSFVIGTGDIGYVTVNGDSEVVSAKRLECSCF